MARGKIQMRRMENPVHRQVTFCKRRAGLLKKAKELSVLCDADIGIVIFSGHGKLYELATSGSMPEMIERYMKSCGDPQDNYDGQLRKPQEAEQELRMLRQERELLQKGLRYMFGEVAGNMPLGELQALERHLEMWIDHVRSAKMWTVFQEIQSLKNKEDTLKAANEILQEKIVHQNLEQRVEQNVFLDLDPLAASIPYPVAIEDDIFQMQQALS